MKYHWVISISTQKLAFIPEVIRFLEECFQYAADAHEPLTDAEWKGPDGEMKCNILKRPYDGQLKLDL